MEIFKYTRDFLDKLLWKKFAGRASVAFHIQHFIGVMDRMLTYANGNSLTEKQYLYLKNEGIPNDQATLKIILNELSQKVNEFLQFLEHTDPNILTDYRKVGKKQLPSTVIGLLFHAAEHSQRHTGQLLVTISALKADI